MQNPIIFAVNSDSIPLNDMAADFWDGKLTITRSGHHERVEVHWTHSQDDLCSNYGFPNTHTLRAAQERLGHPEIIYPPACKECGAAVSLDFPPFNGRAAFIRFIAHAWRNSICEQCASILAELEAERQAKARAAIEEKREKLRVRFGAQYLRDCPDCDGVLYFRKGRHAGSLFIACSAWPDCQHREPILSSAAAPPPNFDEIERIKAEMAAAPKCPKCGAPLSRRTGKYGQFIGCTAWPSCSYTESIPSVRPAAEDDVIAKFE